MRVPKRLGLFALSVSFVLSLLVGPATALGTYTNLSDLTPSGQATDAPTNDYYVNQTSSLAGKTYTVWTEDDFVNGNNDAYLYDKTAGTVTNLSSMLTGGYADGWAQDIQVKQFSNGKPLVVWCEDNNVNDGECFIYDGRTGTVVQPALVGPAQAPSESGVSVNAFAIDGNGNYYFAYNHFGTRGGRDLFLYRSSTNTTVNLSEKLPAGDGTSTDWTEDDKYLQINSSNHAYLVFEAWNATNIKTFLYDVTNDSLTNLSTLAGGVGGFRASIGGTTSATMHFLSDGKPIIFYLDDPTAVAGQNVNAFLYNGDTGTSTNLDALNPDAANYTYAFFNNYYSSVYASTAFRLVGDTPYVVWSSVNATTSRADVMFYNGNAGTFTNLSKQLPGGAAAIAPGGVAAWDGNGMIGFDATAKPYVYFTEGASSTSSNLYKYNVTAGTVSAGFDAVRSFPSFSSYADLLDRSDGEPYLEVVANTTGSERHAQLIDLATTSVKDLTTLSSPGAGPFTDYVSATYADGAPLVLWVQSSGGSNDETFLYDGHDNSVTNLDTSLLALNGEGENDAYDPVIYTDEDQNAILTWSDYYGVRGEADRFLAVVPASNVTPPPGGGGGGGNTGGTGNQSQGGSGTTTPPTKTTAHTTTTATTTPAPSGYDPIYLSNYPHYTDGTGQDLSVAANQVVYVDVGAGTATQQYDFTPADIDNSGATLHFANGTDVRVGIDETKQVDVDGDGAPDMVVVLHGVGTDYNLADFTFAAYQQRAGALAGTGTTGGSKEHTGVLGAGIRLVKALPNMVVYFFPYILFFLLAIEAGMLFRQAARELRAYRLLQTMLGRARDVDDVKRTFLQLASHYLRTPITVLMGGIDLLDMDKSVAPAAVAELKTVSQKLRTQAENLITQAHDLDQQTVVSGVEGRQALRVGRMALMWLPVALCAVVWLVFIYLADRAGKFSVDQVAFAVQILVFTIVVVMLYRALRARQLHRRDRENLDRILQQESVLAQSRDKLITDALATLKDGTNRLDRLPMDGRGSVALQAVQDGKKQLHDMLAKFTMAHQLRGTFSTEPHVKVTLGALFNQAMASLKTELEAKKVTVKLAADSSLQVRDAELVAHVLATLISNAVAYSADQSTVEVSVVRKDTGTDILVTDQGSGIPASKLTLLFQPFTKVEGAEVFNHEGMGFNLYLDKLIMLYVGGDISVTSLPGKGTTATMLLPV